MSRLSADPDAPTWIWNTRWSMRDVDEVKRLAEAGWDAPGLAELFLVTEEELLGLCARNGIALRGRVPGGLA